MNDILSPESYTYLFNLIIEYSPKILLGLIFLFVGNRAIKRVINILEKFLNNKKIDKSTKVSLVDKLKSLIDWYEWQNNN